MSGPGVGYVRSGLDMSYQDRSTRQYVNKSCFPPRNLIKLDTKTH
jgi:hypothetical protein